MRRFTLPPDGSWPPKGLGTDGVGLFELMGESTRKRRGSPRRDPAKRQAVIDNINRIAPNGADEIHRLIVAEIGKDKAVTLQSVQAMYGKTAPAVETETVRQVARALNCQPSDLLTAGYWQHRGTTTRTIVEPDLALETSNALGDMMSEVEDAIDADPLTVAETSAALMRSELRHLHAFFARWMLSRLKRKQERTLREPAELRSLESTSR